MKFTLLFFLLFISSFLSAQETVAGISLFDSLRKEKNIVIRLIYPFDSLVKTNNNEIDAMINIRTASGSLLHDAPLKLNLRGKFRRMKCSMPPLLLNFKKSTLKDLNMLPYDEIKLVTHCLEGPEGMLNLEEERMIYQMYESITPVSYRTIWVNVEYCNASNQGECLQSVGFLLEPDKVISRRLGIVERKSFNMAEDSLDLSCYSNAVAFNFLIGNRDWSIVSSRNAKLFYDPAIEKYKIIPYDFDYSNIVGASYRRETLSKSMTHPFDRIYEGEYFKPLSGKILKSFCVIEKTIIDIVHAAPNPMDTERRKKISRYLSNWFEMVRKSKTEDLIYGKVCGYGGEL